MTTIFQQLTEFRIAINIVNNMHMEQPLPTANSADVLLSNKQS